jgi:hypothetical protein
MDAVKSEAIRALEYDPLSKRVLVHFHSGGSHQFGPFEPHEYDAFRSAPSVGKHFHAYVKKKAIK